jgi:hypothetical protein
MRKVRTQITRAAAMLLSAGLLTTAWAEPSDVHLDNGLADCVKVIDYAYLLESKMPYLVVEIQEQRSLVECGCNTPAGAYRVQALGDPVTQVGLSNTGATDTETGAVDLLGARVVFDDRRYKQLPLASGVELIEGRDLEVILMCAR